MQSNEDILNKIESDLGIDQLNEMVSNIPPSVSINEKERESLEDKINLGFDNSSNINTSQANIKKMSKSTLIEKVLELEEKTGISCNKSHNQLNKMTKDDLYRLMGNLINNGINQ